MNVPITYSDLEDLRRNLADLRGYRSDADLKLSLEDKKTIAQAEAIVSAFSNLLGQFSYGAETFNQLEDHFNTAIVYNSKEAQ